MSTTTKNFLTKKVIIVVAVLSVGVLSAILALSSLSQATAQEEQRMMMMMTLGEGMPRINGSVNVADEATNFINENVKVSFMAAAQTAQGQIANGTVLGGHLGVLQGYLVYTFFVANTYNQTGHLIVVDSGNGNVLYTSESQSFGALLHSMMLGPWGENGRFGGWHGHGKPHWFGGGIWH
ncbi:MAG: hypothetical protein M3270_08375 [Thermoproteota archaeon]|nr:hypothetical protein [Thermoproteota archaeon]